MKEQMKSDLDNSPVVYIDGTVDAEMPDSEFSQDDADELAALMGESVEKRKEAVQEMERFPLGHTIELTKPVLNANGEYIRDVTFSRELTGKDVAKLPADGSMSMLHQMALIGACTGLHSSIIVKMSSPDIMKCLPVVASFLVAGPLTGTKQ